MAVWRDIRRAVSEMPREAKTVGIIILVVVAVLIISNVAGDDSSDAGAISAKACLDAWDALDDFQAGTRDVSSTVGALRSAASTARHGASMDSKYEPIAQWIVGAESEVAAGDLGANAGELYAECGPGRNP